MTAFAVWLTSLVLCTKKEKKNNHRPNSRQKKSTAVFYFCSSKYSVWSASCSTWTERYSRKCIRFFFFFNVSFGLQYLQLLVYEFLIVLCASQCRNYIEVAAFWKKENKNKTLSPVTVTANLTLNPPRAVRKVGISPPKVSVFIKTLTV